MKKAVEPHSTIETDLVKLLDWFETYYSPEDRGEDGRPKGAAITVNGVKGKVVITIYYEKSNN